MTNLPNYVSRRRPSLVQRRYWEMMAACRALVASDLSDEAKEAACLSVLQDHVGQIALSRYGRRDVQLRFYADMLVLRKDLTPMLVRNDFGRLAIIPMYRWVDEWVRSHGIHPGAPYRGRCG
jgi:hypothetical protein